MTPIDFRRILCPVTFSETSRQTVEGAAILAAMYDAELRLFHVVSPNGGGDRDAEILMGSLFVMSRRLEGRIRVSAAIAYGDPSSEISQHAGLMASDLIVMGVAHRSTPAELLATVPAAVVATHATCPVLLVRPDFARSLEERRQGFADILCCVDFLTSSVDTAHYAFAAVDDAQARVTLLNVLSCEEKDAAELDAARTSDVEERMRVIRCTAHSTHSGVEVALTGLPGPEIVALAKRIQCDLIVIGARNHIAADPRLGSTTAYVMSHALCPVLIVPPRLRDAPHHAVGGDLPAAAPLR
jgi:nucleotide-binding universal stress UspA family protein